MLAAGPALPAAAAVPFRLGVTDWNLRQSSQLEAVSMAASLGFEGVEISLGRKPVDGSLPLSARDVQDRYLAAAKQHRIALAGTCLDILHVNYLKLDKLGEKWVADSIPVTARLKAGQVLLPFFGKGKLETEAEMDYVGDILRNIAPVAEEAGVVLALETTLNAKGNLRIADRSRSKAVQVYYDCGNLKVAGFDPIAEWYAMKDRVCQIHIKDNPHYLGEGSIDMAKVMGLIRQASFSGFVNLETDSPAKDIAGDMRRNLAYIRRLLA